MNCPICKSEPEEYHDEDWGYQLSCLCFHGETEFHQTLDEAYLEWEELCKEENR